ncbi:hypothetical protein VPH35_089142 [Triticum aestivum]
MSWFILGVVPLSKACRRWRRSPAAVVKLRAVCRLVDVRGAAVAMADTEAARGESTTCGVVGRVGCARDDAGRTGAIGLVGRVGCARDVLDVLVQSGSSGRRRTPGVCRRRRRSLAYVAGVVTEHGGDRRQCARSSPWRWPPASVRQIGSAGWVTAVTTTTTKAATTSATMRA